MLNIQIFGASRIEIPRNHSLLNRQHSSLWWLNDKRGQRPDEWAKGRRLLICTDSRDQILGKSTAADVLGNLFGKRKLEHDCLSPKDGDFI